MINGKLLSASAAVQPTYIEDVFSTYLFTGTGAALTINNGIDLEGEGGLVWQKSRTNAAYDHNLFDTARGVTKKLLTNTNLQEITETTYLTAFNANGFSVGSDAGYNQSGAGIVTWTFRQAPRFFDVVTYTGTGSNRTIAHSLGVVPGCIIVKRTDTTGAWQVYHRSLANTEYLVLNTTAAKATGTTRWNSTTPTSTVFSLGTDATVNASGGTYVAYLFAHDPLGPSGDGSDGLIACGSFTTVSNAATVTLGWEPQFVLVKKSDAAESWVLMDNMRDGTFTNSLLADSTGTQTTGYSGSARPTATGFTSSRADATFIYIAIRRGPMREPESGTEVFQPVAYTGTGAARDMTASLGGSPDLVYIRTRLGGGDNPFYTKLSGIGKYLWTNSTAAEVSYTNEVTGWLNNGYRLTTNNVNSVNSLGANYVTHMFRRAPGFFDVVAYTGTGVARTINHNLGVAPELIITKTRSGTTGWNTYVGALGADKYLQVNQQNAVATNTGYWNNTSPTESVFSVGANSQTNNSGSTYIAYLFATLPGISKVGSYTGNGSNQTINCGFTTGARFILIKRTDSTGYWLVWDTARGIVSGNDSFLALNLTNAEFTSYDIIDPDSSGFVINQEASFNMNVNAASYIYLAIA